VFDVVLYFSFGCLLCLCARGCLRRLILGSESWFSMLQMLRRLSLICRKTLSVMGFIM
jgi:hypothetical protein